MALTAVAGPITNVLLAFLACFLYLLAVSLYGSVAEIFAPRSLGFRIYLTLIDFLAIFHTLNLSFAVFNLLPISPLDGSRLLYLFLPRRAHRWFVEHERVIYFGVLAWLFLGDRFYQLLLRLQPIAASPALSALASIFSPAVWLSRIIQPLSSLMVRFWTLLPFLA